MKKLFTLLSVALASSMMANAEIKTSEVELFWYVYNGSDYVENGDSQLTDFTYDTDTQLFSLTNYMNSGLDLCFTMDMNAETYELPEGATSTAKIAVQLAENNLMDYYDDGKLYLYNFETKTYGVGHLDFYDDSEETIDVTFPFFYGNTSNQLNQFVWCYGPAYTTPFCLRNYFYAQFDGTGHYAYSYVYLPDLAGILSGEGAVGSLASDNAAPEYFNLQGVRVADPENGVFIKKQNGKAQKIRL